MQVLLNVQGIALLLLKPTLNSKFAQGLFFLSSRRVGLLFLLRAYTLPLVVAGVVKLIYHGSVAFSH